MIVFQFYVIIFNTYTTICLHFEHFLRLCYLHSLDKLDDRVHIWKTYRPKFRNFHFRNIRGGMPQCIDRIQDRIAHFHNLKILILKKAETIVIIV